MRIGAVFICFGEIWFDADCLVAVSDRFLKLADAGLGKRAIAVGLSEVRFDPDRFIIV